MIQRHRKVSPPRAEMPRLRREVNRYWVSVAVSIGAVLSGTVVASLLGAGMTLSLNSLVVVYFGAWAAFSLTYTLLTWLVLRRAGASELPSWMYETPAQTRTRRLSQTLLGTGSTTSAITLAVFALGSVTVVAIQPSLREDAVVVTLAVLVVATSWSLLISVLAVRYASVDPGGESLRFAGLQDEKPVYADFCYLAIQVVTTFSTSDVTVMSRELRREISAHSIIAFAFNTVIVALLVSVLILAAS